MKNIIKSSIREQQEMDGIIYPLDIPECVTLHAKDKQLERKYYEQRKKKGI